MKSKKFNLTRGDIIFFICMHILGYFSIRSSVLDWQLQQTLIRYGIPTEAIIHQCSQSRPTSCWMDYEYQAFSASGEALHYEVAHITSCVYCENLLTTTVRYLPEDPQIVAIEGERNILFVFGIFFIIGAWLTVLIDFISDKWRSVKN